MNKILGILCSAFDLAGGVAGGLLVSNFPDGYLPFGLNSIEMESYSIFYPKRWGILVEIGR